MLITSPTNKNSKNTARTVKVTGYSKSTASILQTIIK